MFRERDTGRCPQSRNGAGDVAGLLGCGRRHGPVHVRALRMGLDLDLALRARKSGYGLYTTEMAYINHFGRKTANTHFGGHRYHWGASAAMIRDCVERMAGPPLWVSCGRWGWPIIVSGTSHFRSPARRAARRAPRRLACRRLQQVRGRGDGGCRPGHPCRDLTCPRGAFRRQDRS